jgi:acylglycerol lipase
MGAAGGASQAAAARMGVLAGVDGLRLAYRAWEVAAPRAALAVVHGLGEHAGRYAELASALAAGSISTYALDLRGHGESDGRRGDVPSFDVHLEEVDRFRREVAGLAPAGTPLFLLGQSMGGLIVLRYLQEYDAPLHGAIISSPWLATAMPVPRWKLLLGRVLRRAAPGLPIRHGMDAALLSRDPHIVAAYEADPLVHGVITPRTFAGLSAAMRAAPQRVAGLARQPLLFVLGGDDRIVDTGRTLELTRELTRAGTAGDVTVRVWDGCRHEPLNELGRERVHADVRDWISARSQPSRG